MELYRSSGRSLEQVPKELGIGPTTLHRRHPQLGDQDHQHDELTPNERAEMRRLRRENRRLKEEREILKKGRGLLRARERDAVSIYRFIAAEKANHKVWLMCALLGVSRSGFYAWQRRPPCRQAQEDELLLQRICQLHTEARGVYGVRRVHAELRLAHDIRIGRKRVERLMRQAGLSGLVRRRHAQTTIRLQGVRVAEDLVARDFNPQAPNRLWVADITYLPTWEGWLYLAAVQDAYSRTIVGWSMGTHMRAELVVDALKMALAR